MRKILLALGVLCVIGVMPALPAYAQGVGTPGWCNSSQRTPSEMQLCAAAGPQGANIGQATDVRVTAVLVIKALLTFATTIIFLLDTYAGYLWMTAAGNEEQVTSAKTIIKNATIGLIVIVFAYSITLVATNLALGQPLSFGASGSGGTLESAVASWFR